MALLLSVSVSAAPRQQGTAPAPSLDRIKGELAKAPPRRFEPETPQQLRVTFKARVDQRVFVPTLEEHLHKEFDLTPLQRQSADWAARCCGFDLGQLVEWTQTAMRERKIRKTREQIARELAELAAIKAAADVKRE